MESLLSFFSSQSGEAKHIFFYLAHKITFTINVFLNKADSGVKKENVLPLQEKEPVTGKTL